MHHFLNSFPAHASQALELAKMQEMTLQKEYEAQMAVNSILFIQIVPSILVLQQQKYLF